MKAIKSIAVVGVAAGMLAAGAGAASAHEGDKAKHDDKSRHASKAHKKSTKVVKKRVYIEDDSVKGSAFGSPGYLSGNVTQAVTGLDTNACGNTTDLGAGILNPAFGNTCVNR
ncbi:chaplin [Streptomyces sp. NPDC002055]|uniref:chaplin n=1 Tax=Streptomyces sp. NPDC002055 TaxID=3154534 RepID=UPI0033285ED2